MYRMTAFQKSYILTNYCVQVKCPIIGGYIKKVAPELRVGKKLFPNLHYIFRKLKKKISYVLRVRVNLKLQFLPPDWSLLAYFTGRYYIPPFICELNKEFLWKSHYIPSRTPFFPFLIYKMNYVCSEAFKSGQSKLFKSCLPENLLIPLLNALSYMQRSHEVSPPY